MGWSDVFLQYDAEVLSRAELRAAGATGRALTAAVRFGHLVRLRRDHYCLPSCDRAVQEAVRVGGVLDCASALRSYGVFALSGRETHLRLDRAMSRMRAPMTGRLRPLSEANRGGAVLHWDPVEHPVQPHRVSLPDALLQSLRCSPPTIALASIDNALHQKLIGWDDVVEIFSAAPRRVRYLRELVDGRAEAGQETVLRMLVIEAGLPFDLQVEIPGVGRVDILVAGRLILEADSRLAHDGWEAQLRDRGRDLVAATMGYVTLRPAYQHTLFHSELVTAAIVASLGRS